MYLYLIQELTADELVVFNKLLNEVVNNNNGRLLDIAEIKNKVFGNNAEVPLFLINKCIRQINKENLALQSNTKVQEVFWDIYCPGFNQKSLKEQITFANKHGDAEALMEQLLNASRANEIIEHFKEFDIPLNRKLVICKTIFSGKHKLLIERVYSNILKESIESDIINWAKAKAKKMGIPLVSKGVGQGNRYDGKVEFYGGCAPFTYSDASGGIKSGGFTTEECNQLN